VTGYGQKGDRDRSAAAGFDRHLVKPVGLEQVRRTLEELAPR
jgi:CheY-like chemotaxis protein